MIKLSELLSESRDSINEELIRKKFSSIGDEEIPIWFGSPTSFSYAPRYILASIIFSVHFIFYRVATTVYAEGREGFLYIFLRFMDQLFDLVDVFAFVFVMLIIARINHFLNISTSNVKISFFLIIVGIIPSIWFITNVIDWFLILIGENGLNIPEWLDTWFLGLGIINSSVFLIYSVISQLSYSYLVTDKNIYIKRKILFYNSFTIIAIDEIVNLKTQISFFGKMLGYGNLLLITEKDLEVKSNSNIERNGLQKFFYILKLLISYKRQRKELTLKPSECFFGVKNPMLVYQLADEIIDNNNGEIEI